jgi:hypothetical protein
LYVRGAYIEGKRLCCWSHPNPREGDDTDIQYRDHTDAIVDPSCFWQSQSNACLNPAGIKSFLIDWWSKLPMQIECVAQTALRLLRRVSSDQSRFLLAGYMNRCKENQAVARCTSTSGAGAFHAPTWTLDYFLGGCVSNVVQSEVAHTWTLIYTLSPCVNWSFLYFQETI